MNEGHYVSIRNYLEEIASQSRQILGELKRNNELLGQLMSIPAQHVESTPPPATKTAAKKGK